MHLGAGQRPACCLPSLHAHAPARLEVPRWCLQVKAPSHTSLKIGFAQFYIIWRCEMSVQFTYYRKPVMHESRKGFVEIWKLLETPRIFLIVFFFFFRVSWNILTNDLEETTFATSTILFHFSKRTLKFLFDLTKRSNANSIQVIFTSPIHWKHLQWVLRFMYQNRK